MGDSCSNVLNKINIISAAGLWGINVSDEHFLVRGRVVFGDVFLFPIFHNVLNKINIISAAAGLWGINVSDGYFHMGGRVLFGDVLLFIPNLAQFSYVRKKNRKTNR